MERRLSSVAAMSCEQYDHQCNRIRTSVTSVPGFQQQPCPSADSVKERRH